MLGAKNAPHSGGWKTNHIHGILPCRQNNHCTLHFPQFRQQNTPYRTAVKELSVVLTVPTGHRPILVACHASRAKRVQGILLILDFMKMVVTNPGHGLLQDMTFMFNAACRMVVGRDWLNLWSSTTWHNHKACERPFSVSTRTSVISSRSSVICIPKPSHLDKKAHQHYSLRGVPADQGSYCIWYGKSPSKAHRLSSFLKFLRILPPSSTLLKQGWSHPLCLATVDHPLVWPPQSDCYILLVTC